MSKDKWFGNDKVAHFGMATIGIKLLRNLHTPWQWIIIIAVVVSVGKEIYDIFRSDGFSYKDLPYDLFGIVLGFII